MNYSNVNFFFFYRVWLYDKIDIHQFTSIVVNYLFGAQERNGTSTYA